jgi:hypothetical protein
MHVLEGLKDGKGVHIETPKWIDALMFSIKGIMAISLVTINASWLGMRPKRMIAWDFRDNIYRNTSMPERRPFGPLIDGRTPNPHQVRTGRANKMRTRIRGPWF